ncbi:hypothetical protein NEMIN01_0206 [Nematocida minor]|uniref:uncharacterized protein n=1 Tax=Nematocida minor TaxID=1912983 RepID=UPI00221E8DCE|nr:uncharacterized protein NEMIN01_0102 [Nematocida minor]XP_051332108.1 uncharacterized protein NEMIN01_0206 [Nematocida minor]KAI5188838.1 hypothetical protein NEMIN01_0102 [Nematocida minor]KAI5188942.1 hypothetical protein NEMIN01_0206 [Nematocida minor]
MFEYKRPISSIIDGPRFTIAQIGNAYCVVAAVGNFYKTYSAEKLSTLGRCREGETIKSITSLGRYVVAAAGTEIDIYNQGASIQKIDVKEEIKEVLAYEDFLVVKLEKKVIRVDFDEIEKIEEKTVEHTITELSNTPSEMESVHKLELKNKLLIVAQGQLHIYAIDKKRVIYTMKCASISEKVVDVSSSISPEIVAISTAKEVMVVQLKKDVLLQQFAFDGIQSVDFRRSVQHKELAVLTEKEVIILCLEQAVAKKRYSLARKKASSTEPSYMHTARYIGSNGYLIISQKNELQILDCQQSKIALCKRRGGVVFGEHQCSEFLQDTLVVSTNGRVYTLSLRKEEQLKEFSKMNAQGHPTSLAIVRENILACYTKGIHSLKETVGGVTETKRRLGSGTPKEYIGAVLSFCGNAMALSIKESAAAVKILVASRDSGFILGEIEEKPYLALSINNIKKTLTVLHATHIVVYSYRGEVLSKTEISCAELETQESLSTGELLGKIVETRAYKYCIVASSSHICIFSGKGEKIKSIAKAEGVPLGIRVSTDLSWILLMTKREQGAVLEVVDMETCCILSETSFPYVPKDFLITEDKSRLIVTTAKQILLFENTYRMKKVEHGEACVESQGITFSSAHKSRIRLLLSYESFGVKVEDEGAALYILQKENMENSLSPESSALKSIEALLDGNCPISSIIAHIKETEDPTGLIIDLIAHLETKYDIAEALVNRVLYYRRRDLDMDRLSQPLKTREEITERFIATYLSTLSLVEST